MLLCPDCVKLAWADGPKPLQREGWAVCAHCGETCICCVVPRSLLHFTEPHPRPRKAATALPAAHPGPTPPPYQPPSIRDLAYVEKGGGGNTIEKKYREAEE